MIFTSNQLRAILVAIAVGLPSTAFAQGAESEPNNSCLTAQDVGGPELPFSIFGSLDSAGGTPDIDFFRFSGSPGDTVVASHQGASSGAGTVGDPLLGLFDSACNLLAVNDDFAGLDSRLVFDVPGDGFYVLAATAFPDFQFTGGGEGSYTLTVDSFAAIDSISGRLVNAEDGSPLSGDHPTFAAAFLLRCHQGVCFDTVGSQNTDPDGNFRFDSDFSGNPLTVGSYQLQALASGFEFFVSEIFDVAEGEALDLGDIGLTPFDFIGSISGRVVNAVTGEPVPGLSPPFASVTIERCDNGGICFPIFGTLVDDLGHFHVDGMLFGLPPGDYRVSAIADDFRQTTTEIFPIAEDQDLDVGDIPITPFPFQFGAVHGCEVPPGGGLCEYGIELRNSGDRPITGSAWSTIDLFRNEAPFRSSRFQVGRLGATVPLPERVSLRPGEGTVLTFQLFVPGDLPDESVFCATATVGTSPLPHFNNQGDRFVFCAVTHGSEVRMISELEGRGRLQQLRRQSLQQTGISRRSVYRDIPSGRISRE